MIMVLVRDDHVCQLLRENAVRIKSSFNERKCAGIAAIYQYQMIFIAQNDRVDPIIVRSDGKRNIEHNDCFHINKTLHPLLIEYFNKKCALNHQCKAGVVSWLLVPSGYQPAQRKERSARRRRKGAQEVYSRLSNGRQK
jgi:hypothetical protein